MENERLARLEEKCDRIQHIEAKLDDFIADEQSRREKYAFSKGRLAALVLMLSMISSVVSTWWIGRK